MEKKEIEKVVRTCEKRINAEIEGQYFEFSTFKNDIYADTKTLRMIFESKSKPGRFLSATITKTDKGWDIDKLSFKDPGFKEMDLLNNKIEKILNNQLDEDDYLIYQTGYLKSTPETYYEKSHKVVTNAAYGIWVDNEAAKNIDFDELISECKAEGILALDIELIPKELYAGYENACNSMRVYQYRDYIRACKKKNENYDTQTLYKQEMHFCFGKPDKIIKNESERNNGFFKEECY